MKHRYAAPGPVTVRGALDPAVRQAVEAAVRAGLARALGAGAPTDEVAPGRPAPRGERVAADRLVLDGIGYRVPSYDDRGRPVELPLLPRGADPADLADAGATSTPAAELTPPASGGSGGPPPSGSLGGAPGAAGLSGPDLGARPPAAPDAAGVVALIRSQRTGPGEGVARGVYLNRRGTEYPLLYYLPEGGGDTLPALKIFRQLPDREEIEALAEGEYTLIAHPHSPAQLYRGSRRLDDLANPSGLDLTVTFSVPPPSGVDPFEVVVHAPRRYRFWPRVRVYRREDTRDPTVGADVGYAAGVEIWRVDDGERWVRLHPLALPYAFLRYSWQVTRIERLTGGGVHRHVTATSSGRRAFFTHVFPAAGEFEVDCSVVLTYDDASPAPVADRRVDRVRSLEESMALDLAVLQRQAGAGEKIWATSADALLQQARQAVRTAENATPRKEALVEHLRAAVRKLERQLSGRTGAGPFPLQAIFADRRTGRSRPISLFVGPAPAEDQEPGQQTWRLIDVTFPAFYRTYEGHGQTAAEALRAAFEDARTSFRGNYPPGRILARIEWPGIAAYGVSPFDLATDTESWQRSAYEWLSIGGSAIGAIGLAAALVFPPTSAVVGAVVVAGAVAGGITAGINIAERINNNAFEWDAQTALDLLSIATSFAAVAGVAARGAVAGITRAVEAGEPVTISMVSRLRTLVGFQRAVLYMDIGTTLGSGVLLAEEIYLELREIDAALGPEALPEFRRLYGEEEGLRRWEAERTTRILGVLARAAVNGTLTAVSVRGTRQGLAAAAERYAALHIPGLDRNPSIRLPVVPGAPLPPFPTNELAADPAGFRRAQVDGVIARLGLPGDAAALAVAERLGPQAAWQMNTAMDALTERQRGLLLAVFRPGGADLVELRRFLDVGGSLTEIATLLENQPGLVRRGIGTFATATRRAAEFRELVASVPDPATFRWTPENLELHFRRHVLGTAGYPAESWKWAQRLGIAAEYGFDRARWTALLHSTAAADTTLRTELLTRFQGRYGEYVKTVLVRSNVFARSGRGADLLGSDGELLWAARADGTISSGYFVETDELQDKVLHALREGQSVMLLFGRQ